MRMSRLTSKLTLLAAASVAFVLAPRVHAQIVTFNTIVAANGSLTEGFTNGDTALSQTFSDVAELNSLTYQFVEIGNDTVAQTVNAYLVQWNTNGSSSSVMSTISLPNGTPQPHTATTDTTTALSATPLDTFTVPPATDPSWTQQSYSGGGTYQGFQETLNINQVLDPSLTYAIVLIDTTNASGLGLPGVSTEGFNSSFQLVSTNSFSGYGTGYVSAVPFTTITSMENAPVNGPINGQTYNDYGFSQIALVPGNNVVPVPEPRTAAAILCALFVAGLVGRQLVLRRKDEVSVAALAA
jgi:hypothetical protein